MSEEMFNHTIWCKSVEEAVPFSRCFEKCFTRKGEVCANFQDNLQLYTSKINYPGSIQPVFWGGIIGDTSNGH